MFASSTGPLTPAQQADLRTVELPGCLIINDVDRRPDFQRFIRKLVANWSASGRISDPKTGFGFASSGVISEQALMDAVLQDPRTYIASAFTDGDVPERYKWNAVRKIYELLRLLQEGYDISGTLEAVQHYADLLRPAVPSENPDGSVPWGPFSYGGAVIRRRGDLLVVSAFSIWTQEEDDDVADQGADWQLNQVVPV